MTSAHYIQENPDFPIALRRVVKNDYSCVGLDMLWKCLDEKEVFTFDVYSTGLFPAIGRGSRVAQTSGYRAAWVRDNVHVAYAHFAGERNEAAVRCTEAIARFYLEHVRWFSDIVEGRKSAHHPMNRPHIRFDGERLVPFSKKWPHAQNDAIGAFIWLLCRLLVNGAMKLTRPLFDLLSMMVLYLEAIQFWQDEDSGHWEEERKISASSIGVVNAGLREYEQLRRQQAPDDSCVVSLQKIDALRQRGQAAMNHILPLECNQREPQKKRRDDAALLFLIDPFDIVSASQSAQIIANVERHLQGKYGIRRYLLDSYWGPDYRIVPADKRTIDLSEGIHQRDRFAVAGKEAQWCIFDSIMSIYWGIRFKQQRESEYLMNQTVYFNRALSQLVETPSGDLQIPEAYFVENGHYVPNDHMPLQWAQANLWRAIAKMRESCALRNTHGASRSETIPEGGTRTD
ncbi:MAG: phosphorylase kinase [Deltaproteobacteria bacterium]|nr:phosphorylase kinase [Deltaproteobacteria bacterium]